MATSILARVAAGDASAVEDCLREFGGLVWSLARRLSANPTDAEDAVQEVFIELWKNAGRYDPSVASEATFIAMIARRRLIDRQRKQGRQPSIASLPDEPSLPAVQEQDRVELGEEVDRAREGLRQLRSEERQVLELSIYQGLSQRQIAEQTDMPLGTVKTHARRGLMRLRQLLGEQPAEAAAGGAQ